jgi:hypothetical protein
VPALRLDVRVSPAGRVIANRVEPGDAKPEPGPRRRLQPGEIIRIIGDPESATAELAARFGVAASTIWRHRSGSSATAKLLAEFDAARATALRSRARRERRAD